VTSIDSAEEALVDSVRREMSVASLIARGGAFIASRLPVGAPKPNSGR